MKHGLGDKDFDANSHELREFLENNSGRNEEEIGHRGAESTKGNGGEFMGHSSEHSTTNIQRSTMKGRVNGVGYAVKEKVMF